MRQPFPHPKEAVIISRYLSNSSKQKASPPLIPTVLVICGIAILLVLLVLFLLPKKQGQHQQVQINQQLQPSASAEQSLPQTEQRIPSGVSISRISVGGMTAQQAIQAVRSAVSDAHQKETMVLSVGDQTLRLSPEQTGVHLNVEGAVASALESSSAEDIPLLLELDSSLLMEELQRFFISLGGIYLPSGYWLEGEAPDPEQGGPCQTLVLNPGSAGFVVDLQDVYDQVVNAYTRGGFRVTLEAPSQRKEPQKLDLDKVFQQVSIPAQNPRVDPQTLEVIPGKDGYGFDPKQASTLLECAQPGETIRVPMEYLSPLVSEADAWFQDTLGYCKTAYKDNENRTENLRLACSKLNGLILQPGQILSYNETLGKRTSDAGYKPAPAYSGTELVDEVGGGICQVSSTLYLSALFAELGVVERKNHGYPAEYIPMGLDATVNWGTTDLKLRNDYDLPVKILAEVSDGFVKVRIMGVERRDYYVKMEYRVDDHPTYAAAYRCRYDRQTDQEISRTLHSTSIYLEEVWCWPGYAENAVDEPVAGGT